MQKSQSAKLVFCYPHLVCVNINGTSVHNDKLGNPDKIKVFGIRQTNITKKNTGMPFVGVTMGGISVMNI